MGAAQAESSQRINRAGTRRRQTDYQRHYPYAAVGWPLARMPARIGSYTTIYNRFNRWAKRGRWRAIFEALAKLGKDSVALSLDSTSIKSSSLCFRRKKGECSQAIGRSRGGRTTKIHALSDPLCRPVTFLLTPGQDADIAGAPAVLALAPAQRI